MWERFSKKARETIIFAQEEAHRLGQNYVGTEHLLLGLIRDKQNLAVKILTSLGINLEDLRKAIESEILKGIPPASRDKVFTPRTKISIEYAFDEARLWNHNYIGTEHLLLGLLREEEGVAASVLKDFGINISKARKKTETLLGQKFNYEKALIKNVSFIRPKYHDIESCSFCYRKKMQVNILFQTSDNAICDYCISRYYEALQKKDYELYSPPHHQKIINLTATIIVKACKANYDIMKIIGGEEPKVEYYKEDNLCEVSQLDEIGGNVNSLFQRIKLMANIMEAELPAKGRLGLGIEEQDFDMIITQEKEDTMIFEIKKKDK